MTPPPKFSHDATVKINELVLSGTTVETPNDYPRIFIEVDYWETSSHLLVVRLSVAEPIETFVERLP